uniref:Transmembrane protein 222-like n=2 Tax=Hirondellea gigas TaxID=1518452 RepID=A0A2P2I2P9_9CRUS
MSYWSEYRSLMDDSNTVETGKSKASEADTGSSSTEIMDRKHAKLDIKKHRFPNCIVWTPLPLLTWIFPVIGHMGIADSNGIIHDFAGPYMVSEDNMAFGWPTKYWQLDPYSAQAGADNYDKMLHMASQEYRNRMHNLCCDNCHSHVAMALNLMRYDNSSSWNMFKLCFLMLAHSKYVSFWGFLKTWLPFLLLTACIVTFVCVF